MEIKGLYSRSKSAHLSHSQKLYFGPRHLITTKHSRVRTNRLAQILFILFDGISFDKLQVTKTRITGCCASVTVSLLFCRERDYRWRLLVIDFLLADRGDRGCKTSCSLGIDCTTGTVGVWCIRYIYYRPCVK